MRTPGRNTPCPCGSGKKYKHCCAGKAFQFVDETEDSYAIALPIDGRLRELIVKLAVTFRKHFEREPGEGDPIFLTKYLMSEQDIKREMVEAMERSGADPAHIYAYRKTGYLIVEGNIARFTGAALQEWESAISDFCDGRAEISDGPEADLFDSTLNALADEFESFVYALGLANDNFFNLEALHQGAKSSAHLLTPAQYQALCVSRVHRSLRSVINLTEKRYSEDVLKLARSMYESYLHMVLVQNDPQTLEILVDVVIGLRSGTHEYKTRRDGGEDRRFVVELSTGREVASHISSFRMAESSRIAEDVPFFDFFYRTTSEFLHPTVFALDAYMSSNGLDPVKPHMHEESIIFTACVAAMVTDALFNIPNCPDRVKIDCRTVVKRTRTKLLTLLDQLDVWRGRMGATQNDISILRARCVRLTEA
ncbi:conserved hypothetical protein [Candidatus Nitrotoga sp. HW29]|uniref:DUF5677 domain-containing protein n=1 Tax=Candidatus Nitrotoga sp. HW29 TaxID=2886963 RepID=UPI001EF32319|nr:DUF5677 domain-containing protein [Candidatus Nitrotoga sp. HW29]CAH1905719.1 conserved hypothetical protein [Candidatus Nitrotoga sp. HW29]